MMCTKWKYGMNSSEAEEKRKITRTHIYKFKKKEPKENYLLAIFKNLCWSRCNGNRQNGI